MDLDGASSTGEKYRFKPQFTAVILTNDDDNSLYPLTNELPKSLLPVGNRPILKYQLDILSSSGFIEVIVVTTRDWYPRVSQFIVNEYRGDLRVDLVQVDNDFGTAEMLKAVAKKIRTQDVLVLDGGVIVGKHLNDVLDLHRVRQSHVTMLLKNVGNTVEEASAADKGKKKKTPAEEDEEDEMEFIGIVPSDNRVIMKIPASSLEDQTQPTSKPLRLSKALLRRVSCYTLHSNLMDSCLYVLSRWILELLESKEDTFVSLDQDLVPYVIRQQFKGEEVLAKYVKDPIGATETQIMIAGLSSGAPVVHPEDGVRCYAHILPAQQSACLKITSTTSYLAANRDIMASVPSELSAWAPLEGLRRKESVIVGEGAEMGDKVNVRMSVIGAGCKIGSRVKINGCVIMDNAVIADGCTLQNTIVCNNATVEEDCSLTDCYVGALVTVSAGSKSKEEEFIRE